jgi:salicylate hydroxylase
MNQKLRVALVGGGLGGLTAALALTRDGFDAHVFEQADHLRELGAGIGLSPNALKVLREFGLEHAVRECGAVTEAIVGRDWTTGRELYRTALKGANEIRFGLSNVQIHRGDLLGILASSISASQIHLNSRCVAVSSSNHRAGLTLADGVREEFDLLVGCDGIRSNVRTALHGLEAPRYTGNMCWRALVEAEKLPHGHLAPEMTNWMGPGGHIVTYYVRKESLVNVVAVRETDTWAEESWSVEADAGELVAAYPNVHARLRAVLEGAEHCFKWGLFDRDPLPAWGKQRMTLLGDAAHPMLPFLGQGAAMAIEDAYVLARELARSPQDVISALRAYEAERVPRASRVQLAARDRQKILHMASAATRLHRLCRNWLDRWDPLRSTDVSMDWIYDYDPTRQRA